MGGPKASSAMRTISIARTTPAQNPRGFSKSRFFWLSDTYSSFCIECLKDTLSPILRSKKATGKNPLGQRKPKNRVGLAAEGEKAGEDGKRLYLLPYLL